MLNASETGLSPRELILATCEIPAVPVVAVKVLRLVDDPHASIRDLQRVIMADQAIASRVLRVANSAFYGRRQRIDTISEAITVLGLKSIKTITLAVSTREVYRRFGLVEQKLWEHSLGVSVACGIIASQVSIVKAEEAVVAGLVHDIGKVIMNNSHPDRFNILMQNLYERSVAFTSLEGEVFGFTHAEVGSLLAEKWGFPEDLRRAILYHHSMASSDPALDGEVIIAAVALADTLCVKLGVGYRGPMPHLDLGEGILLKILGISSDRYAVLVSLFKDAYLRERTFYMDH
jgi:putative nucleotidyltransferase with HDIG domain